MSKNKKKTRQASSDRPDEALLRKRIQDSGFSALSLRRAMDELVQEFEEDEEPYWLEGATEAVAETLSKLVSVEEGPQYAKAELAEILEYCADALGVGADAASAASELASAQSTLFYDEGDITDLESARETLVDSLNELADLLEKYETE